MLKFLARKSRAERKTLLLYKFNPSSGKIPCPKLRAKANFTPKAVPGRALSRGFKTKYKFAPLNFNPRPQNQAKFHAEFHF